MNKKYFFTALLFIMPLLMMSCKLKQESTSSISEAKENKSDRAGKNSLKVFILAGQSNMEGQGVVEPEDKHKSKNGGKGTLRFLVKNSDDKAKFRHLVDTSGNWTSRNDVWFVDLDKSGPLTVEGMRLIGPETQFGHIIGDYYEGSNVLLIKTAWGGKSLYEDFRPPSSGGKVGPSYKDMINRVNGVLNNIKKFYPDYNGQGFEIAGFGWHQGWNDRVSDQGVAEYQENCVNLINDLRAEFNKPDMPFVLATTGMTGWSEDNPRALALMNAQLAVPNDNKLKVKKNVKAVETRGFWREEAVSPTSQGYHWNGNAESYFLIGDGIGKSMTKLLESGRGDNDDALEPDSDVIEAEDFTLKNESVKKSKKSDFTGSGYMEIGVEGSWIQWNRVMVPSNGKYKLTFRYLCEFKGCNSDIIVNDSSAGVISFKTSGSGETWETATLAVRLTKGRNTVRVEAKTADGGLILDHMKLELGPEN
jgi:hypothetical protein